MARVVGSFTLHKALQAEGYQLPDETTLVEIVGEVDSVMQMRITVNLTDESLAQVGRALVRMAEDGK